MKKILLCFIITIFSLNFILLQAINKEKEHIKKFEQSLLCEKDILPPKFENNEVLNYDDRNIDTKDTFQYHDKRIMTISAYSPRECETDSTPFITANNTRVKEGGIAISRDMEKKYGWKLGDKLYIPSINRTFEINDRMNKRWTLRGDIFFFDTKEALDFGVMEDVEVFHRKST